MYGFDFKLYTSFRHYNSYDKLMETTASAMHYKNNLDFDETKLEVGIEEAPTREDVVSQEDVGLQAPCTLPASVQLQGSGWS